MDHKEAHHLRLYVLAALFFIVAAVYIGVLYDTQVNNYDYYYASSVRSIARSETVEAARAISPTETAKCWCPAAPPTT